MRRLVLPAFALVALVAATASAQVLTAPTVAARAEATYPREALRARLEASVGLELDVDAEGRVTGARVTKPAGHGFDESALEAVKRIVFVPAKRDGVAIPATIDFTYEFHLPPAPPPPPPKPALTQTGPDQSTVVLAHRPISAASSFTVRDRDFQLRPIGSVQDILRVTPGLVLVQHSGGGKANQYFLRGFDADHGTDIAFSIDGVPINMPSHAHGQGYSDTNFIIPEVVEHVQVTKGPLFCESGRLRNGGRDQPGVARRVRPVVDRRRVRRLARPRRAELPRAPRREPAHRRRLARDVRGSTSGAPTGRSTTPRTGTSSSCSTSSRGPSARRQSLKLTEMSYEGNWHGSGQLPERAVAMGLSRFGSIDPDEGGDSARHQVALEYELRPSEKSELSALAYVGTYRFDLFSNFTLYARDPQNGDEIEQVDRRTFYGGKLAYRVVETWHGVRFDTTIGGDVRSDDIHEELSDTLHRRVLATVRSDDVSETIAGAYANEEVSPWKWLRFAIGGRADLLTFSVDDKLGGPSGTDGATQLSPKLAAIATAVDRKDAELELYVDYGHGFHSNDVRGAFGAQPVTPLVRAIGEEVGMRGRFWNRFDVAASLWMLDLASETVWNGDDGTTAPSDPTNRYGLEVESRLEITKWLAADLDVTLTHSAFTVNHGNASGALALAPKQTWSGGLSMRHPLGPGAIRAGLRFFGIGERPASDDGAITVPAWTELDLHVGYRAKRFDLALDAENLFDAQFYSAAFDTVSRLRTDPAIGAPIPPGFSCGANARLAAGPAPNRFTAARGSTSRRRTLFRRASPARSFSTDHEEAPRPPRPLRVRRSGARRRGRRVSAGDECRGDVVARDARPGRSDARRGVARVPRRRGERLRVRLAPARRRPDRRPLEGPALGRDGRDAPRAARPGDGRRRLRDRRDSLAGGGRPRHAEHLPGAFRRRDLRRGDVQALQTLIAMLVTIRSSPTGHRVARSPRRAR